MLERQGIKLNRKKLYRLYKEERLTVRKRGGRKTRSRYGGMEVSDARRLKALEEANRRLKKVLAESMLDASTLKEMSKGLI
jgi:hypothetical protein